MENKMLRKMFSLLIVMSLLVVVAPAVMSISYKVTKSYDSKYYNYYEYDTYSDYEYDSYDYDYYEYYEYYPYYNYKYKTYNYMVLNFFEKLFERFPTLENLFQKFLF